MDVSSTTPPGEKAVDFVLLGPTGFLGSAICRALEVDGYRVQASRVRLHDRLAIEKLLDESRPAVGVICAAGERGRPNISWCDAHPVETVDANITGQLAVAAACHARGLHVIILGTGGFYAANPGEVGRRFSEDDPPNATTSVYFSLRQKMEDLLAFFDNSLTLRVLYPVSSDVDPRGLIGKLARFDKVDRVSASVTVLEDLCPLIPELAKRRVTGVLNFTNAGTVSYADIVAELAVRGPPGWRQPRIEAPQVDSRAAPELDVTRLAAACGQTIPDGSASIRRIIAALSEEELNKLAPQASSQL